MEAPFSRPVFASTISFTSRFKALMAVPWRAAEAIHWMTDKLNMARRAGVTPFSLGKCGCVKRRDTRACSYGGMISFRYHADRLNVLSFLRPGL